MPRRGGDDISGEPRAAGRITQERDPALVGPQRDQNPSERRIKQIGADRIEHDDNAQRDQEETAGAFDITTATPRSIGMIGTPIRPSEAPTARVL